MLSLKHKHNFFYYYNYITIALARINNPLALTATLASLLYLIQSTHRRQLLTQELVTLRTPFEQAIYEGRVRGRVRSVPLPGPNPLRMQKEETDVEDESVENEWQCLSTDFDIDSFSRDRSAAIEELKN